MLERWARESVAYGPAPDRSTDTGAGKCGPGTHPNEQGVCVDDDEPEEESLRKALQAALLKN